MSKKMYACLSCGLVSSKGKIVRERHDTIGGGSHYPSKSFHGFITYRVCPDCGSRHQIKCEEDKKTGGDKNVRTTKES